MRRDVNDGAHSADHQSSLNLNVVAVSERQDKLAILETDRGKRDSAFSLRKIGE